MEIISPGLLTTIQDPGRPGYEEYGIPASGAFDPFLAEIANYVLGNEHTAAVLEFALIGPSLRFRQDTWIAISSFDASFDLNGAAVPLFTAIQAKKDSELAFVQMRGWFGYIAFAGGLDGETVLGSASTYLAGGIGRRLKKGDVLKIRSSDDRRRWKLQTEFLDAVVPPSLWLLHGLHTVLFSMDERLKLTGGEYRIQPQSNRMGIYLSGAKLNAPLVRRSAPALPGTVQILPGGDPLILGAEGPVTGGYPQAGVLSRSSWTALARTKPGERVRLEWHTAEEARGLWKQRNAFFQSRTAWLEI